MIGEGEMVTRGRGKGGGGRGKGTIICNSLIL